MARTNQQDVTGFNFWWQSGRLGYTEVTLTGDYGLRTESPILHLLNPGGANRNVTLPAFAPGMVFQIVHIGTANSLVIKNAAGTTLATIGLGESVHVYSTRNSWIAAPYTFGPAGSSHRAGLVPDPGVTSGLLRFLCDDGTWKSVTEEGTVDAYKTISDGTNTAVAAGLTTLRLRSSDSSLSITAGNNDATFGDNVNFTVNAAGINHDALLNWVADKHVAHSTIDIVAGEGLSGGGTIDASRSLALALGELTAKAISAADFIPFFKDSDSTHGKITFANFNAALDHNALTNYVANRHIDHTAVSISAGTGLSGGGDISASRTINISWSGLTAKPEGMAAGDLFAYYDASLAAHYKITFSELNTSLDHNALTNYDANRHIDHTAVSITGTGNLTGGGTIAASRTLDMANMAQYRVKGRISSGSGTPEDLTGAQVWETIHQGLVVAEKTTAGSYTMLSADDIILINKSSGAATTVDLVTASGRKRPVKIVDLKGDAATNPITIDGSAAETIVGATTYVINFNYGSVTLYPNPAGNGWYI